ncbi:MAG TPA: YciI family protein [Euzebya sp.]|nr:YciI family protein [Euzebya sp.]
MEYAVLLYESETRWDQLSEAEQAQALAAHDRFTDMVHAGGGTILDGAELAPSAQARSLRWSGSQVDAVDGPYAETTEQFGGLYLIEAPDLDRMIEWCRHLPHSSEIRPTAVAEDPADDTGSAADTGPAGDEVAGSGAGEDAEGLHVWVLLYGDEGEWEHADEAQRAAVYDQHRRFSQSVVDAGGAVLGGRELANSSNATSLRRSDGDWLITDGPFIESIEQLSGWYDLRAPDMATLEQLLRGLPGGTTEIRPVAS